jgi:molybdopterin molybdotransferase
MLSFEAARAKVIETIRAEKGLSVPARPTEKLDIAQTPALALGRVLAEAVICDRNYPPFDRSTRDGYAVRSSDFRESPAKLPLFGESRAGVPFAGELKAGACVRIMTGAALPKGADSVVMQEFTRAEGELIHFEKAPRQGQNVVPEGAEARKGEVALAQGTRLGFAELAMAAQVGQKSLRVFSKPRVAILSTGDEVVERDREPGPFQIRNSNSVSLAAQVTITGGEAVLLGNAPDRLSELRERIELGLQADILVISGGVSVGAYDLVETVLRELGTEFFFDAIAIRPGRPAVFGMVRGKPIFGLPGNPVSTMVTFELLAAPAIELLLGLDPGFLPLFKAKLRVAVEQNAPLTHFLPAQVTWPMSEPTVEPLPWEGSGDIGTITKANCFLVLHETNRKLKAGDWADVLPRRDKF